LQQGLKAPAQIGNVGAGYVQEGGAFLPCRLLERPEEQLAFDRA
jgi:hypothetical protein